MPPMVNPDMCDRATRGWWCSRIPGHEGPCAAYPSWWNFRQWRTLREMFRGRL